MAVVKLTRRGYCLRMNKPTSYLLHRHVLETGSPTLVHLELDANAHDYSRYLQRLDKGPTLIEKPLSVMDRLTKRSVWDRSTKSILIKQTEQDKQNL